MGDDALDAVGRPSGARSGDRGDLLMRTMRLSQTISPFGVGAVLDILGESLMGADISTWSYNTTRRITSPRVELALGVSELRSAPSVPSFPAGSTPGIYYQRFPKWNFCQDCR